MRILVTGARGFVGKNLCCALKNVRDGLDRTRSGLVVDEIMEYDLGDEDKLCEYGLTVPDYVDENVSTKVVKIIQSYVGIVDKMVWRKF